MRGVAHITGGGLTENLPRILPKGQSVVVRLKSWKPQPIFKILQREGDVDNAGMFRTFNMGVGMVMILARTDAPKALKRLDRVGEKAFIIGEVIKDSAGPKVIYDPPLN